MPNPFLDLLIDLEAEDIAQKAVPRRQREAEIRLEGKLRSLIEEATEGAVDAMLAGYRGPAVQRPFLVVRDRALIAAVEGAEQAASAGYNRIVSAVQRQGKSATFDGSPDELIRRATERIPSSVGAALDRMADSLRATDPEKLAERVDTMLGYEVNRLVRTELNEFQNAGALAAELAYGVPAHEWVSQGDHRVRKSHTSVSGEIVPVGARFSNGLLFPGDRLGPVREWILCRCFLVPVFEAV